MNGARLVIGLLSTVAAACGAGEIGGTGGRSGGDTPGAGTTSINPETKPPVACTSGQPGLRRIRRLTHAEFDNTISDLFGIRSDYGARFAADTVVAGFDNHADVLTVGPLLADQLRVAAEELAERTSPNLAALVPCTLPPTNADGCARDFVRQFGERAFRRPLSDAEVGRYVDLYRTTSTEDGFQEGIRWVITAMLQSPNFLYRRELGVKGEDGRFHLDGYELASALSYFITGSMPDRDLLTLARGGQLSNPAVLAREARRLFRSPRAKETLGRFAGRWLEIDRLTSLSKDAATYPDYSPAIRDKLREETNRFISQVVYQGSGTLAELFTASYSVIDASLARYYGVSAPANVDAAGFGKVELPQGTRAGLLTQGSLLATHAVPNQSSPIRRGKWIRERLLCQPLAPPPPNLNVSPPPLDPNLTGRERYAAHASVEPCRGCHRLIDPIGFTFEHFDGAGRYRETENGKSIDTHGEIVDSRATEAAFNGVAELGRVLGESPEVSGCFVEQWTRFAYGVSPMQEMSCLVEDLSSTFAHGEGTIESLLVALATSPHMTNRIADGGSH